METKPFYASKTFWFNLLFVLVSIAALFGYADFKPDQETVELVALIGGVVNLVLRFFTYKGITAG